MALRSKIDSLLSELNSSTKVLALTCERELSREIVPQVVQPCRPVVMALRSKIGSLLNKIHSSIEVGPLTCKTERCREIVTKVI